MRPDGRKSGEAGGPGGAVFVVGLAGPSGSGKTTLALAVAERVKGTVFALDAYYRDQRDVSESEIQVDVPEAIDVDLAASHLRRLVAGSAVDQPVYDYATHARTGATRVLSPARVIFVEGLFALYWSELRGVFHTSAFVTLDHAECLRRRIARDVRERGRTADEVTHQYERHVRPMYERYVAPTRDHAHAILDGRLPVAAMTEALIRLLGPRSPDETQG